MSGTSAYADDAPQELPPPSSLDQTTSTSSHPRWLDDYLQRSIQQRSPSFPPLVPPLSPLTPSSSLYPSTRPLPLPGPTADPSLIYISVSQFLMDFHLLHQSAAYQSAYREKGARPFGLVEISSTPCGVCQSSSDNFLNAGEQWPVSHAVCRLLVKSANTMLCATASTRLTLLIRAESRWEAALTSDAVLPPSSDPTSVDSEPRGLLHYIAKGDSRWQSTLPLSVLSHVESTRLPLSVYAGEGGESVGGVSFYSDPYFAAFPAPPSFHCLPIIGDHSNLHTVLFLLSTSPLPTPPSHPFHNLHFPGLHLLSSQVSGIHRNAQLMVRLDSAVEQHTQKMEMQLEERRRVESELIQAKAAADRNAAVKSEFLSNMSHEIRTPMNAVLGAARLLGCTPLSGEQSHYLHLISTSGKLLLSLIGDILDINRIESGHMVLETRPFHLTDCIETAVHLCHSTATQKGLDLAMVCEPTVPPSIEGDLTRLSQILINLSDTTSHTRTDTSYHLCPVHTSLPFTDGCAVLRMMSLVLLYVQDFQRHEVHRLRLHHRDSQSKGPRTPPHSPVTRVDHRRRGWRTTRPKRWGEGRSEDRRGLSRTHLPCPLPPNQSSVYPSIDDSPDCCGDVHLHFLFARVIASFGGGGDQCDGHWDRNDRGSAVPSLPGVLTGGRLHRPPSWGQWPRASDQSKVGREDERPHYSAE